MLVLAACAEGLPEGKGCALKCVHMLECRLSQVPYLGSHAKIVCSVISLCAFYRVNCNRVGLPLNTHSLSSVGLATQDYTLVRCLEICY